MPSKTTIAQLGAVSLLLAACSGVRENASPAPAPSKVTVEKPPPVARPPATASRPRPATTARPATKAAPPRTPARADLPGMIGQGAIWADSGLNSIVVKRGDPSTHQPVPLFRQANVLASVRAALANSPAKPRAEFTRGTLTLTFEHGSNEEIAAAVKQALSVPEAENVRVSLQP